MAEPKKKVLPKNAKEDDSIEFKISEVDLRSAQKSPKRKEDRIPQRQVNLDQAQKKKAMKRAGYLEEDRLDILKKRLSPPVRRIQAFVVDIIVIVAVMYFSGGVSKIYDPVLNKISAISVEKDYIYSAANFIKSAVDDPVTEQRINARVDRFINENGMFTLLSNIAYVIRLIVVYFICMVFPLMLAGRTVGKGVLRIKAEHYDGGDINWRQGLGRETLGKFISLISIVGPFLMFKGEMKQSLHDKMFHTIIVNSD